MNDLPLFRNEIAQEHVAGGGIEPPTRGFSVHVSYEGKALKNSACMTDAGHVSCGNETKLPTFTDSN